MGNAVKKWTAAQILAVAGTTSAALSMVGGFSGVSALIGIAGAVMLAGNVAAFLRDRPGYDARDVFMGSRYLRLSQPLPGRAPAFTYDRKSEYPARGNEVGEPRPLRVVPDNCGND